MGSPHLSLDVMSWVFALLYEQQACHHLIILILNLDESMA